MNDTNFNSAVQIPVILVHGWRAEKKEDKLITWDKMKVALEKENIPYYEFNYLPATGDPYKYAGDLEEFVDGIKKSTGYTGKFDIVCHSMGALVSRFYMARNENYKNIRQWIGIAPVNQGSAFADLMDSKGAGYILIKPLLRLLFKDIGSSGSVANMRTYDEQILTLNSSGSNHDGIMPGVTYHIIVSYKVPLQSKSKSAFGNIIEWMVKNSKEEYESYQSLIEKGYLPTRVKFTENGETVYRWTEEGDGAVANIQSMLNNITTQKISGIGHSSLTRDSTVIGMVVNYYRNYKEN